MLHLGGPSMSSPLLAINLAQNTRRASQTNIALRTRKSTKMWCPRSRKTLQAQLNFVSSETKPPAEGRHVSTYICQC